MSESAEEPLGEFLDLLSVEQIGENRFRCQLPDWGGGRVFGGEIVGQAVRAATASVTDGKSIHSLHGYFLRPARPGQPLVFQVSNIRDGRSFATRELSALQGEKEIFRMICSFHGADAGREYQKPIDAAALDPESLEPGWMFGAVETRNVGPTPPDADGTHRSTGRYWLRVIGRLPDDPSLHSSVMGYLSDVTLTSARPPSLGPAENTEGLISVDHAVWFHSEVRPDEWLFYDIHALVHTGGRGTMRGTMHTRDGKLALSMAQEMLIRPLRAD